MGIDTTRASIARVYDAALGGTDNYAIDREVLAQVARAAPEVKDLAWSNRQFLIRAARFVVDQLRIDQFIDCGSGLPTAENTHQVVQRLNDEATVVYVDNDPVVLAHGRALLEENERTHLVDADIFVPEDVLGHEGVRKHIDFDRPVALLHVGTWHHYLDDDAPDLMRRYIEAFAPGSAVVLSHFFDPETAELSPLARRMEELFIHSPMGSGRFRTRAQIEALFGDLRMIEPGVALCDLWWPDGPKIRPLNQVEQCIAGGVGVKE
ncbi:SAM-dependent methyltransferase [Prauserella shujinwangii]|uniref:SAM-dependent methyltransferase n=1 Tax=Prauserella shujinwangii TaxID=1453103 RepID=UPI001FE3EE44|nr:SAM-dependent methyltransferase [Prauserella shujinwangii]